MFAVIVTGPPGAGKTTTLTALADALADDGVPYAAVDVDEVAWAFPFPGLTERCEHLRAWRDSHVRAGATLLVVAEVVEADSHLPLLLAALGADDHLLVRLDAAAATLERRIVAREPDGWSGLAHLLDEAGSFHASQPALRGVHLALDTDSRSPGDVVDAIRRCRPDVLAP